jgi:ERCC4-type nuclease
MISVDRRIGSKHLIKPLRSCGLKVRKTHLEYADVAFDGKGPNGLCPVGIELKRYDDLIHSIQTKRLVGHQIPGLLKTYKFPFLVVEGIYAPDEFGLAVYWSWSKRRWVVPTSRMSYHALASFILSMQLRAGLFFYRSCSPLETTAFISSTYSWFTKKSWGQHAAHLNYDRSHQTGKSERVDEDLFSFHKPRLAYRVAKELPRIGRTMAGRVVKHFGSVEAMAKADLRAWAQIPRVGVKTAKLIVTAIRKGGK